MILDQIFFCDTVVIEPICCRTRAKRLEVLNTCSCFSIYFILRKTERLRFYLRRYNERSRVYQSCCCCACCCDITRPNIFHPSSRFAVVYQSFCSRTTADRLYYDWIAEKNLVEQLYCSSLSVVLLLYNRRSTLLRLDQRKKIWTGKYTAAIIRHMAFVSRRCSSRWIWFPLCKLSDTARRGGSGCCF